MSRYGYTFYVCSFFLACSAACMAKASGFAQAEQTAQQVLPQTKMVQAIKPDASWSAVGNDHFSGAAYLKNAFKQSAPARSYGAYVYFSPGARTNWHLHPLGQTLIVVDGTGLTQAKRPDGSLGPVVRIAPGDVIVCPPGIEHWHGAAPDAAMVHLAISESDPQQPVVWKEAIDETAFREGAVQAVMPQEMR